jgi:hypothetical protein
MASLIDFYQLVKAGLVETFIVTANYTVTNAEFNKAIVVQSPTPQSIELTFPTTLDIGFQCYVVNDNANDSSVNVTLNLANTFTNPENNTVLTGFSVAVYHVGTNDFFVLGNSSRSLQLVNAISITGNNTLIPNTYYEVTGPCTLTFPANPVEGNLIGVIDAPGTFDINPVICNGNGKTIEGNSTFLLNKKDENIQFFYNGNQWIYISRFYFVAPSVGGTGDMEKAVYDTNNNNKVDVAELADNLSGNPTANQYYGTDNSSVKGFYDLPNGNVPMTPLDISANYTLQASDYKKWIRASGNITINVGTQANFFEAIIQNVGNGVITIAGIPPDNTVGDKITVKTRAAHVYYDGVRWTSVGALSL